MSKHFAWIRKSPKIRSRHAVAAHHARRGTGELLDLHTRSAMERRLGGNFGGVRVYRGPLAEEVTARYRADAVTVGGTEMILVREGWQSNFSTVQGGALLAHELTHVRQQQRGLHFHGAGDTSSPLEREAHGEQDSTRAGLRASGRQCVARGICQRPESAHDGSHERSAEALRKKKQQQDVRSNQTRKVSMVPTKQRRRGGTWRTWSRAKSRC